MKSGGSADHLAHYALFGPGCLFPRTFLGLRLLDLIDEDAATTLSRAGLPATRLPNHVLQLDLLDQPWPVTRCPSSRPSSGPIRSHPRPGSSAAAR